jgi:hypothetical protein
MSQYGEFVQGNSIQNLEQNGIRRHYSQPASVSQEVLQKIAARAKVSTQTPGKIKKLF